MILKITLILFFLCFSNLFSNEIIRDKYGNYFLLKSDGSYKKLPPPKPGKKYVIKKKIEKKKFKRKKENKRDTRSAKKHISRMKE
tara:strand:- start:646 stop:900 length:255 start_codon:yes stop_codon:yes gene_type:complete